jgi:hypothetical protein
VEKKNHRSRTTGVAWSLPVTNQREAERARNAAIAAGLVSVHLGNQHL